MTQTPSRLPGTGDMLCFALYSANHAMTRLYRPLLQPLGLTYPQYLVLVALWSEDERRVGALGEELGLDTNTLTPLLKRMAEAGLVTRSRSEATGLSVEELADLRDRIARLNTEIADHL